MNASAALRRGLVIGLAVLVIGSSGCASTEQRASALAPAGSRVDSPVIVRYVVPDADTALQIGDRITEIDDTEVHSIGDVLSLGALKPGRISVDRDGVTIQLPGSALVAPDSGVLKAFWISPGESLLDEFESSTGRTSTGGVAFSGRIVGQVAAYLWDAQPALVEVEVRLFVPGDCTDCALRNISLMDWSRRAFLSAVSLPDAAYTVVPSIGEPRQPIPVPPPTVIGSTSSTVASGTVNAQTMGNQTRGTFAGTASTVTTPIYDYSAQSAAAGYNLGIAIRNAQIQSANQARQRFVADRLGNLRAGTLNPGEVVTGNIFFAVPRGFPGPYIVAIDAGPNAVGYVRFDVPSP